VCAIVSVIVCVVVCVCVYVCVCMCVCVCVCMDTLRMHFATQKLTRELICFGRMFGSWRVFGSFANSVQLREELSLNSMRTFHG